MKIAWKIISKILKEKNSKTKKNISQDIKKILIVNLQGMGDYIMTTPLIHELSKKYEVDILVNTMIIKGLVTEGVNKVIFYKCPGKTFKEVKNENYDLIYLANGAGPKSALFFRIMKGKYHVSHIYDLAGNLTSFKSNISIKQTEKMHRVDENLKLLNYLNMKIPKTPKYYINISKSSEKRAEEFWKKNKLKNKTIIGIHPGGDANNPQKRYPIEKYCEFVNGLDTNKKVLFFLGPDEIKLKKDINKLCNKDNYFIIQKNIPDTISLIKRCNYLIHSDSGLGHIASAVGTKTITLVGPTNWHRTRPYGKLDKILKHPQQKEPEERKMEEGFIINRGFKFIDRIELD